MPVGAVECCRVEGTHETESLKKTRSQKRQHPYTQYLVKFKTSFVGKFSFFCFFYSGQCVFQYICDLCFACDFARFISLVWCSLIPRSLNSYISAKNQLFLLVSDHDYSYTNNMFCYSYTYLPVVYILKLRHDMPKTLLIDLKFGCSHSANILFKSMVPAEITLHFQCFQLVNFYWKLK